MEKEVIKEYVDMVESYREISESSNCDTSCSSSSCYSCYSGDSDTCE